MACLPGVTAVGGQGWGHCAQPRAAGGDACSPPRPVPHLRGVRGGSAGGQQPSVRQRQAVPAAQRLGGAVAALGGGGWQCLTVRVGGSCPSPSSCISPFAVFTAAQPLTVK